MVTNATSVPLSTVQKPGERAERERVRDVALGYGMLAPVIVLLLVFEIFPLFYGLYISACDWRLGCVRFIGADNYVRALQDPDVWHSFLVTATYSLVSVPIQLGLGLLVAYLLFQNITGRSFFRIAFFLPYITSTVASATIWSFLFSPDKGPINATLALLHLPTLRWLNEPTGIFALIGGGLGVAVPGWAAGPSLAMLSIIIFTTWVFLGYDITIFLAGLSNISPELYDAAKVDGAGPWTTFRRITLPLLSPTTYFLLIYTVIGTFKAFNHIYVMTRGGPGGATETASIFIFRQLFESNRYGYSAALSFLLFSVILLLTVLQNRFFGNRVVYD